MHVTDIQNRDGGVSVMATLFGAYPFLLKLDADRGYRSREFQAAMKRIVKNLEFEIVKRSDAQGLRRPAKTPGRRTNFRLALPLSLPDQGLDASKNLAESGVL